LSDPPARRPYLSLDVRHRQLLDAAARLAGRGGLDQLTMVAVAKEAGVSRQLVYEHFGDVPGLVSALLSDRFSKLDAAIAESLRDAPADGTANAVRAAAGMLALPAADRHIIRALLAFASLPDHELAGLATQLRTRMIDRWSAALTTPDSPRSRAMIWAVLHAGFGLGDQVDAGVITADEALNHFSSLLDATFPTSPAFGAGTSIDDGARHRSSKC
jgi:AcrR family transcriptional regulator